MSKRTPTPQPPPPPTTYTVDVKLDCPFCHTRKVFPDMELPRTEPYIATTQCTYCERGYYYVVDNGDGHPSQHPHVVCLRPSEYLAIRAN